MGPTEKMVSAPGRWLRVPRLTEILQAALWRPGREELCTLCGGLLAS